jgi:phospholipid/cholesterol/gamma-HCH transport system substrate-binding protein
MNRSGLETLVGVLVLAVAGAFTWYAVTTTGSGVGGASYELTARFDRVDGVAVGADVRVSGVKVGSVTGLTLDPSDYFVRMRFSVPATLKLPEDTVATITSDGLLGSRYLKLVTGNADEMIAPGGQVTRTQPPVDVIDLISRFAFSSGGGGGAAQRD